MKANIKAISQITGYSPATISNVLNNKRNVNKKTAEEVLRVAQDVGYFCGKKIESIKLVMYKKSGRVLTETPLINALMEGVESESHANGLDTVLCSIKLDDSEFDAKLEALLGERSSGIILLATELEWEDIQPFEGVTAPLVVVDAWFREGHFDTVLMDNTDSVYTAVTCLVENGHRRIGYIGSTIQIRNFYYRERGFREAMAMHGLSADEDCFIRLDPTMNGAYEDMRRYLATGPELPTAFFAVNDIVAFGSMKALQECGYRIPEDVSIIGFDNMPFGGITSPGLTTIDVLKREMGEVAVRRLMEQCKSGGAAPAKIQLLTRLVNRASVKKISAQGN